MPGSAVVSPGGTHLAYVCWDHPSMPWTGTELRVDWFDQITGRDVEPIATNESFHSSDRRIQYRAWVGYWPTRHLRISLMGETSERSGRVNASRASRSEIGLHGGAEVVF